MILFDNTFKVGTQRIRDNFTAQLEGTLAANALMTEGTIIIFLYTVDIGPNGVTKRTINRQGIFSKTALTLMLDILGISPLVNFGVVVEIKLGPMVFVDPDAAQLRNRSELSPFQLVQIMVELIGKSNELVFGLVELQLNFYYYCLPVYRVDQDISVTTFQSVFDADHSQHVRVHFPEPQDFFVKGRNLGLF